MASEPSFVEYICDQLKEAGNITYRKMFGEYGVYCNNKIFGLICDNVLFVKITEAGKLLCPDFPEGLPYDGAKPYIMIDNPDDKDTLCELVRVTCEHLPVQKQKKKKPKSV